jgi:hypothetical protein
MTKRTILTRGALILTPVALAAAAVLVALRPSAGVKQLVPRTPTSEAPAAPALGPGPVIAERTERTYQIRYTTNLGASSGATVAKFALTGRMRLAAVESSPNIVVGCEFRGTFDGGAAADPGEAAQTSLKEALERRFLLQFAPDGRFERALGSAGTPAFVTRLWQALGEYLQVVRENKQTWESQETDATGLYIARYAHEVDALSKQKLRYTSLRPTNLKQYEVRESQARFRFKAGELAGLRLKEVVSATAVEGLFASFESTTELELDAMGAATALDSGAWGPVLANAVPLDPKDAKNDQVAIASHDQARIAGLSVAEALFRLRDLDSEDKEKRSRAERAYVSLTALIRQDPAAIVAVKANVKQDGPLTVALLGALRDASTPEAQAFLAEMSGSNTPLSEARRLEAARCLSRVTTPNAATVRDLAALRSDPIVGLQATYGLGSALHRLQTQDPGLAAHTQAMLVKQLRQAQTPGQKAAVLTAMGNAGSLALLDEIQPHMNDTSPVVRAAAAQALRRIPSRIVDDMLAALSHDQAAEVRLSAVDAMRERGWSPVHVNALIPIARGEAEFAIRSRAVNALSAWFGSDVSIAETLKIVAERDPHQDLRNVAKNALAKHG